MLRLLRSAVMTASICGALAAVAPAAEAGYTIVKQPARRNEAHEQILEQVYGGDFVADSSGLSFSNESGVTVTRLQDGRGATPGAAWTGKHLSARVVAAFSGRRKTAGYFGSASDGQMRKLFESSGRQFNVSGAGESTATVGAELVFGRGTGLTARTLSSVATANSDGMDHLVTYEVKGKTAQPASTYLLCWEDKFARRSDRDYNGLVVEVQAADAAARAPVSQPLLIPLPPAAWPGLTGLLGLGLVSRLRKRAVRRCPMPDRHLQRHQAV